MHAYTKAGLSLVAAGAIAAIAVTSTPSAHAGDDHQIPSWAKRVNAQLADKGLGIAVAEVEYFTIGKSRPADRILQQPFRWVPGDTRRVAAGDDITYMIQEALGATTSGLTAAQTTSAVNSAMETWDATSALRKVDLVRRADDAADNTIFDGFFGGTFGNPFAADIVCAGWWPRALFEAVGGPGGGDGILAFSVTFIFLDDTTGAPSDIDGNNYLDTALNEVYFNDTFGDPGGIRGGNPWKIDALSLPDVDVETVALHELGHSLGIGHFGPQPKALMNPRYSGLQQAPGATDLAAMRTIWSRWPK